jgi:hypothetical protein
MTFADPYSTDAVAPPTSSGQTGAIAAHLLNNPYASIAKQEAPALLIKLLYHPPVLLRERQAAIDHAIAVMDEPVEMVGEFRRFSRDEMHERS